MNEVIKAIKERRSIRHFTDEVPSDELIAQIIEAGLYAPSGVNRQDAIILVIKDPKVREMFRRANYQIGNYEKTNDPFYHAPILLVVLAPRGWRNAKYDGALVMGNLMLAAHSLGLGSTWINGAYEEFEKEEFKKLLKDHGIEGDYEGVGHCAIGYVKGEYPKAHQIKDGRVYYI